MEKTEKSGQKQDNKVRKREKDNKGRKKRGKKTRNNE